MRIPAGQELLDEWEAKKAAGVTKRQWARELGVSFKSLDNRIYKAGRKASGGGKSRPPQPPKGPTLKDDTENNERLVTYVGPEVRTLDDLIDVCKIDESVWNIYKSSFRKWEVGAKLSKKDLEWEDGQIVKGYIRSDGTLTVAPLFYVRADCVKREPEAVTPMVSPVELAVSIPDTPRRVPGYVRKKLIITDWQVGYRRNHRTNRLDPFHDRRAMDVVLQVAQDNVFDGAIHVGDEMDYTEFTDKFQKDPAFYFTTQPAVYETSWWLLQHRLAMPGVPFDLLSSNHGDRLRNFLATHMMAACDLKPAVGYQVNASLSLPELIGLDKLGINYVDGYPNARSWITDDLYCEHGSVARGSPGDTAKAVAQSAQASVVFGHIHRIERATYTRETRGGEHTVTAISPGCLCRLDYVVPGHKRGQNWQQGFAVATYTEDGSYQSVQVYEIKDGETIYEGKRYKARDQVENISRDTGWDFH